jgi:hypothetical protein
MTYRQTVRGTTVRLIKQLSESKAKDKCWLVEAVTKKGCYICQVAESDLTPLESEQEPQILQGPDEED